MFANCLVGCQPTLDVNGAKPESPSSNTDTTNVKSGGVAPMVEEDQYVNNNSNPQAPAAGQTKVSSDHVGRNDPCPCGSGKKYKKCHGA